MPEQTRCTAPGDIRRSEADEEIARLLRDGESYRPIARSMGISQQKIAKINRKVARNREE